MVNVNPEQFVVNDFRSVWVVEPGAVHTNAMDSHMFRPSAARVHTIMYVITIAQAESKNNEIIFIKANGTFFHFLIFTFILL